MMQTILRRRAFACLSFAALLFASPASAQTATNNPEDEYKKLVKVDEEIAPLGETPFGESVNVYDGGLSFHVVDITIPGTGPTIEISRTFQADGDADVRKDNASFGDWDIDLPRFSTLTSAQDSVVLGPVQVGWVVDAPAANRHDRCTYFGRPPDLRTGRPPGDDPITPDRWWNQGYLLRIPGATDQDMLIRSPSSPAAPQMPGLNFVAVSKGNWHIACLPHTSNGEPGEAFLAVGPDGSRYWLDHLAYRRARPFGAIRNLGMMFATRMEDRFGNWIAYRYESGKIRAIDASDGRRVTFGYTADDKYVAQVNVLAGGQQRTWRYAYGPTATGVTLTSVQLPDGSGWAYDLQQLAFNVRSTPVPGHCLDPSLPDESLLKIGTIAAPSGLSGVFEARPTRHGRSDVWEYCDIPNGGNASSPAYEKVPRYTNNLALRRKTFSGAGMTRQVWSYDYPVANASWRTQCESGGCDFTTHSDVTDPSGNITRYTFSNRADVSEGKPLKTEYFGTSTATPPVRVDTYGYAQPGQGPWPTEYGGWFNAFANFDRAVREIPSNERHVFVDGDRYDWQVLAFDAFARPTSVRRSNSVGYSVDERQSYLDDASRWVIGLPLQSDNLSTGETVSRNVYSPGSLTLAERYHFGRKVMSYAFNAQGQLAGFTDGNGNTTTLGNYKRGIPQSIGYPDGTSQSLTVDDFGQIASITNQAGATTSYGYNEIGRLASITYPTGDSVAWNSKLFGYGLAGASERGIDGPHWRRSVTQGGKVQMTYFDAMLRPIITDSYRSDGSFYTSARTDYDWKGRKTFQSYAYEGAPSLAAMDHGVASRYDVLGRQVQSIQHSEWGDLSTTTEYLSGAARRVTDAKGNRTTSWFQVFDEPSSEAVVRVEAPEGVVQTIQRDVYGNPLSMTQGGAGASLTKTLTYDGEHRLCRRWEPESGSEIMDYDGAGNLTWSVQGALFNGEGCGRDQVASASRTIRAYDAMNRVTSVVYPVGTAPSTFTYDALG